jgi:mono/diheme cytochrome c family protein
MIILPVLRGLIQGARSGKEDDISISGNSPPRIGLSGAVALSLVLFGGGGLGLWYGGQERVETSLRVGEEGRGKFLYERNCLSCHGLDADGTDKAPSLIEKKYPNQYLWLRVSGGGLKMPPIPALEESDVREISRYLESIDR